MTAPQIVRSRATRPPEPDDGVYYPMACDVLPPEGMLHFVQQSYMQSALETWLNDPGALVASQMFIYYESGNPRACVAPDVCVIPNVGNDIRRSYFLWLEHETPTFVMEVASPSTYRNDLGSKNDLYAGWGVQEYWQYDPEGRLLTPLLQGRRLVNGQYLPIPVETTADGPQCIAYSALLELEFLARREWFRFRDPTTGRIIPNLQESEQERRDAEQERRDAERALARERSARLQLESLLRQHGIEPPRGGDETTP